MCMKITNRFFITFFPAWIVVFVAFAPVLKFSILHGFASPLLYTLFIHSSLIFGQIFWTIRHFAHTQLMFKRNTNRNGLIKFCNIDFLCRRMVFLSTCAQVQWCLKKKEETATTTKNTFDPFGPSTTTQHHTWMHRKRYTTMLISSDICTTFKNDRRSVQLLVFSVTRAPCTFHLISFSHSSFAFPLSMLNGIWCQVQ